MSWRLLAQFVLPAFLTTMSLAQSPEIPRTPAPANELISATPFKVDQPFRFTWQAEAATFTEGYILVLDVDPDLIFPRQVKEPVLYVGAQTAMRINSGYESGRVVAIVPVRDLVTYRLEDQMIWFGAPAFPDQVSQEQMKSEREKAELAELKPVGKQALERAMEESGRNALDHLHAATFRDLMPHIGSLVKKYSPDETNRIRSLNGG